jgi:hypothetical protein
MVIVLAGMVGYLYWQQNKVLQVISSLSSVVATQYKAPEPVESDTESDEDDRVSVKEEVEVVKDLQEDVDDIQTKTSVELRDLLSKKGIPFGKRDSKTVLLQLLKATG